MQPTTARKSVPARTSGAQFSGVMPPIAQDGSSIISDHQARISGSSKVESLPWSWTERTHRTRHNPRRPRPLAWRDRGSPCRSRPRSGPGRSMPWPDAPAYPPARHGPRRTRSAPPDRHDHSAGTRHSRDCATGPQHVDRPPPRVVVDVLEPQLHRRHVACVERRGEPVANRDGSSAGGVIR
jgi:hypothetical protein